MRIAKRGALASVAALVATLMMQSASVAATSSTTTVAKSTSSSLIGGGRSYLSAIFALIFGVLAIWSVLFFLFRDRARSFKLLSDDAAQGVAASPVDEPSQEPMRAAITANQATVVGPASLRVGTQSTYHIHPSSDAATTWKLDGDGQLGPNTGNQTTVTPTGIGVLVLMATQNDTPLKKVINATAPPATGSAQVPILGVGYGSVVVALAVASVTAALGLTQVISGEAVATILGSLVSYSVARGVAASSGGSGAQGGGTGAS